MHTFPNLGPKLKEARIKSGLTRNQVASSLSLSVSGIGLYESGERIPSLYVLVRLAAKYKVSLDYLLDNQPPHADSLNLDGLTAKQLKVLRDVIDCFQD